MHTVAKAVSACVTRGIGSSLYSTVELNVPAVSALASDTSAQVSALKCQLEHVGGAMGECDVAVQET